MQVTYEETARRRPFVFRNENGTLVKKRTAKAVYDALGRKNISMSDMSDDARRAYDAYLGIRGAGYNGLCSLVR